MPRPTLKTATENAAIYKQLMSEVKTRLRIANLVREQNYPLYGTFVQEFVVLQIRLITELVALGCLVAHGDIPAVGRKKLTKEYSPSTIITCLKDLNPYCFPQSVKFSNDDGKQIMNPGDAVYVTSEQLISLHGKCGTLLHRGNLRDLTKAIENRNQQFQSIVSEAKHIIELLSAHVIVMDEGDWFYICVLENTHTNGELTVSVASKQQEWD